MSMVYCPECSERFSAAASACPHCGFPFGSLLANNHAITKRFIDALECKGSEQLLLDVASDELAEPSILEALAQVDNTEVARRLAENPRTPEAVLDWLTFIDDKEIRFRVARNAHTGAKTLSRLYVQIREQERLVHGRFLHYRSLNGENHTDNRALKVALALNHNTPIDVLEGLYDDDDSIVNAAVFGNNRLPKRFFFETNEVVEGFWMVGPCGMLNPLIPYRDLMYGLQHGDKRKVVRNSRLYGCAEDVIGYADIKMFENVYAYRYVEAIEGAGHQRLPKESLMAIEHVGRGYPDEIVLNSAVTPGVLEKVFDEDTARLVWIAKNPTSPGHIIETLYRSYPESVIAVAAATNPSLPKNVFIERYGEARTETNDEDAEEDYDYYEYDNYDYMHDDTGPSPSELNYSGWEYDSEWAEYGIDADVDYWDDMAMDVLMDNMRDYLSDIAEAQMSAEIAEFESSLNDFKQKCKEEYWEFLVDYAFASNPSTPAHALEILAEHGGDIAMAVASNPNAPQELLKRLFDNEDCWDAVVMNPSASIDLLESLDNDDEEDAPTPINVNAMPKSQESDDKNIPF